MTDFLSPSEHLQLAGSIHADAWKNVEEFRQDRGKDLPDWPDWCFLPLAAWYAIVSQGRELTTLSQVAEVSRLAAVGTWRYSQGIYRFDEAVYGPLSETVPVGEMPAEVLFRLPEWCVYIETPGRQWLGQPMHGFFAHLEHDANTGRPELRLLINADSLVPVPLHIGPWTITEAVDRAIGEAVGNATKHGLHNLSISREQVTESMSSDAYGLVSLLLYLCSEEPDIDDDRQPGQSPGRPRPKRTKQGWRLFAAPRPRVWSVGKKIGNEIRAAQYDAQDRSMTPHLRRAHWHGFWRGPRDSERKFFYKWIPPIFVQGAKELQDDNNTSAN